MCNNHTSSFFQRLPFVTSGRCWSIQYSIATLQKIIHTSIDSFSDFNTQTLGIFVLTCHFILIIFPFYAFLLFCKVFSLYQDIQIVHLLYYTDRDDSGSDVQ